MASEFLPFLGLFEVIGVGLGLIALYLGLTRGRSAIKLTGGGVVGVTATYLLLATGLFIIGFSFRAFSFLAEMELASAIGSIIMFGTGACFFKIFWELSKHMDQLKSFT